MLGLDGLVAGGGEGLFEAGLGLLGVLVALVGRVDDGKGEVLVGRLLALDGPQTEERVFISAEDVEGNTFAGSLGHVRLHAWLMMDRSCATPEILQTRHRMMNTP